MSKNNLAFKSWVNNLTVSNLKDQLKLVDLSKGIMIQETSCQGKGIKIHTSVSLGKGDKSHIEKSCGFLYHWNSRGVFIMKGAPEDQVSTYYSYESITQITIES